MEPWEGGGSIFRNGDCLRAVAESLGQNTSRILKKKMVRSGFSFLGFLRHAIADLLLFCVPSLGLRRVQLLNCIHFIF